MKIGFNLEVHVSTEPNSQGEKDLVSRLWELTMDQIFPVQFLATDAPKNLTEEAYRKIKLLFYHQRLIAGQKILYEELAKTFNMSRTPVINALGRLEREGYVTCERNRGYFIAKITAKEARDNIDAREVIEEYCVKMVIARFKRDFREEHREYFENLMDYYNEYRPDFPDRVRLFIDRDFHIGVCQLANNSTMLHILDQLFEKIYLRYPVINARERLIEAESEHRELIDAIVGLDLDTALAVLQKHYKGVRYYLSVAINRL